MHQHERSAHRRRNARRYLHGEHDEAQGILDRPPFPHLPDAPVGDPLRDIVSEHHEVACSPLLYHPQPRVDDLGYRVVPLRSVEPPAADARPLRLGHLADEHPVPLHDLGFVVPETDRHPDRVRPLREVVVGGDRTAVEFALQLFNEEFVPSECDLPHISRHYGALFPDESNHKRHTMDPEPPARGGRLQSPQLPHNRINLSMPHRVAVSCRRSPPGRMPGGPAREKHSQVAAER